VNKRYVSDLTDSQWDKVKPFVEKNFGRPAQVSRREVVNAILYVMRMCCEPAASGKPWMQPASVQGQRLMPAFRNGSVKASSLSYGR